MSPSASGVEVTKSVTATTLVATAVQDEPRKLPKDNTAMFSRADRKVRFELVKLSGNREQNLAGMSVTVIDPTGITKQLTADNSGVATLDGATPGLHAVVIGGEQGHGAIAIALREAPAKADDDLAPAPAPAKVRLPLVDIEPKEVITLARAAKSAQPQLSYADIDNDFVSDGALSESYGFRVQLSGDGTMIGQVISLVKNGVISTNVAGTNIVIYRGNSLAGRAVADQKGYFKIGGLTAGVYGLIASGSAGYAAFAFETVAAQTVAATPSADGIRLVSTANAAERGDAVLPVVMVPPPMVEPLIASLELSYGPLLGPSGAGGAGIGPAALSGLAGAGFGGGGGGATGTSGGLGGGIGGLGLAAAAIPAAIGLAIENDDDDLPGIVASPSL